MLEVSRVYPTGQVQVGSVKGDRDRDRGAWTVCFFLEMWAVGAYLGYVILQEKGQRICTQPDGSLPLSALFDYFVFAVLQLVS